LVAGEDVAAGKPDPECYLLAALRLQSEAHRCIVVEDAAEGVAAPKAAGMRVIVVGRHGEQPGLAKADHVVMSLEEVIADLEGWSLL
jgi:beta-phosphoglucomutase-like phosphatase (HAD superfamily)